MAAFDFTEIPEAHLEQLRRRSKTALSLLDDAGPGGGLSCALNADNLSRRLQLTAADHGDVHLTFRFFLEPEPDG
jgi:hypothetical protein